MAGKRWVLGAAQRARQGRVRGSPSLQSCGCTVGWLSGSPAHQFRALTSQAGNACRWRCDVQPDHAGNTARFAPGTRTRCHPHLPRTENELDCCTVAIENRRFRPSMRTARRTVSPGQGQLDGSIPFNHRFSKPARSESPITVRLCPENNSERLRVILFSFIPLQDGLGTRHGKPDKVKRFNV